MVFIFLFFLLHNTNWYLLGTNPIIAIFFPFFSYCIIDNFTGFLSQHACLLLSLTVDGLFIKVCRKRLFSNLLLLLFIFAAIFVLRFVICELSSDLSHILPILPVDRSLITYLLTYTFWVRRSKVKVTRTQNRNAHSAIHLSFIIRFF